MLIKIITKVYWIFVPKVLSKKKIIMNKKKILKVQLKMAIKALLLMTINNNPYNSYSNLLKINNKMKI